MRLLLFSYILIFSQFSYAKTLPCPNIEQDDLPVVGNLGSTHLKSCSLTASKEKVELKARLNMHLKEKVCFISDPFGDGCFDHKNKYNCKADYTISLRINDGCTIDMTELKKHRFECHGWTAFAIQAIEFFAKDAVHEFVEDEIKLALYDEIDENDVLRQFCKMQ